MKHLAVDTALNFVKIGSRQSGIEGSASGEVEALHHALVLKFLRFSLKWFVCVTKALCW